MIKNLMQRHGLVSTRNVFFALAPMTSFSACFSKELTVNKLQKQHPILLHSFTVNIESVFTLERFVNTRERTRVLALAGDLNMGTNIPHYKYAFMCA